MAWGRAAFVAVDGGGDNGAGYYWWRGGGVRREGGIVGAGRKVGGREGSAEDTNVSRSKRVRMEGRRLNRELVVWIECTGRGGVGVISVKADGKEGWNVEGRW